MWRLSENKEWHLLEQQFDWVRDMNGVRQDAIHHEEGDVAIHTQMVLSSLEQIQHYRQLPEQEQHILWAAALLHDVEKRSTTILEEDGSITSWGTPKKAPLRLVLFFTNKLPHPFR